MILSSSGGARPVEHVNNHIWNAPARSAIVRAVGGSRTQVRRNRLLRRCCSDYSVLAAGVLTGIAMTTGLIAAFCGSAGK